MRKFIAFSFCLFSALALQAQNFVNGQAARAVVGQYTFTYGGAVPDLYPSVPGQQLLGGLSGLAWANGTLFVADSNRVAAVPPDHRVVMFNTSLIPAPNADLTNAPAYSKYNCKLCGFPAYNQLGQPSFTPPPFSTSCPASDVSSSPCFLPGVNNTASTPNMSNPTAVASDGNIVAVADTDNNRVLIWKTFPSALNQPADVVLGQPDFTTLQSPPVVDAKSLRGPQGVWIQNGKLFVADTQNYRILIWNSIPTSNNQPADLVLGQSNFTTGTQAACDPTTSNYVAAANEVCNPVSVTSDGVHVFVADLGFNRVLIWNSIPNSNGQNADVVVGQPDMKSAVSNNPVFCTQASGPQGQCAATLNFPRFALSDGVRLFIADGGNDRVLIFDAIPASNGVSANQVLGQPDMYSDVVTLNSQNFASTTIDNTSGVDVTPSPTSLAFDGTNLYVSDPNDNRVLVFTPGQTPLPPRSVLNWAAEIVRQEGIVSLALPATTGAIVANDTVSVTIQGKAYTYTVLKADTLDTIAQGLVSAINSGAGDPNATAIFAGAGTGSLYLSSRGVNLGNDTISFSTTTSNSADIVSVASGNGYLSSGNAATAAPGMLVEINGVNLSDLPTGNPAVAALSGTIPRTLGGAQVYMDGIAAPLFSVSATQIISQVPFEFTERNSTSIYVRTQHNDGSLSLTNATPVYIAPANPGLFDTRTSSPPPWAAAGAVHQPGNPEAVIDLTGTVKAGDALTISINNVGYSYTVQGSDTLASVTNSLVAAINNKPDPLVTASVGAAFNRVVVTAKQAGAAGNGIAVSTSVSSGAQITLTAYTSATCCAVVPNSLITVGNPAAPGEVITMSAAGLGQINDPSGAALGYAITGQPYNGPADNNATNSVSATMGGTTAQVVQAGLAQGAYGVYQVQMIVPSGQAANNATQVYIAQNAYVSNIVTLPVGPANSNPNPPPVGNSPLTINLDSPGSGAAVSGLVNVAGWAIDKNTTVSAVQVSVDGQPAGTAGYGSPRPDVCASHGNPAGCPNVGFNFALDTSQYPDGPHTLQVTATDASGARLTIGGSFKSSNYSSLTTTQGFIDLPAARSGPFQGTATFSGWALSQDAPISSVTVLIDGAPRGTATYGLGRPDVCAAYPGSVNCPNVGWSFLLDTTTLGNGTHSFAIKIEATDGERAILSNPLVVANWTTADPIIINIDNPNTQSAPLSGSKVIGGWAVSQNSKISTVSIAVDGVPLGDAGYNGSRADVCNAIGNYPGCPNVGWAFRLDTTLIADGVHTLRVTATPTSGQASTVTSQFKVSNIGTSANPTRLSVDTPSPQSPAFTGVAAFGGWALNDNAPISTVEVFVDGVFSGYAGYGSVREDVCAKFVNRPGCPDVGWNYLLDTTPYTNGSHTVDVTATAANGQRATASGTFTVANSAPSGPTSIAITQPGAQSNPFQGLAAFSGSAVNTGSIIVGVTISVDGYPYGPATFVSASPGTPVVWSYLLNTAQFTDGNHTLGVTATAADGTFAVQSATFTVANWSSPDPVNITIDRPSASSGFLSGQTGFGGWVLDQYSPIASVSIAIDGLPYGGASYGFSRPDVCKAHPGALGCPNVGWNIQVDTTLLSNGTHTLAVTATTPGGQSSTMNTSFVVAN